MKKKQLVRDMSIRVNFRSIQNNSIRWYGYKQNYKRYKNHEGGQTLTLVHVGRFRAYGLEGEELDKRRVQRGFNSICNMLLF